HITIFKNHGIDAGTSLEHPHSQMIATPVTSLQVRERFQQALRHFDDYGDAFSVKCWKRNCRTKLASSWFPSTSSRSKCMPRRLRSAPTFTRGGTWPASAM